MAKSTTLHQIELTNKELYLIWAIVCWFNSPVTSVLKAKLAAMAFHPERHKYERFDGRIEDRIIQLGRWLEQNRAQKQKQL